MHETENKRIVKNSMALYVRMLFTMGLNLLITRFILRYLGADDYGTYSAVGGVVSLFTVLNGGIVKANQRFITYELGSKKGHPLKMFNTIINLTLLVAIVMTLIIEIFGLWILYHKMNIPEGRMDAAFWIFQFTVITMLVTLISNPYNAMIIAHERIGTFAYISILQVFLNFIAAWCLRYVFMDKLIYYGLTVMGVQILIRIVYQVYCLRHFKEARYHMYMNRKQVKEVAKFTGWTTIEGALGTVIWQGITILFNLFFGVAINAVYQIASQLKNAVLSFAQNVQRAMDPQITKSYASGDVNRFHTLIFSGSKFEVFMIFFILIPLLVRLDFVLRLWLGDNLPEHLTAFCRMMVSMNLICCAFEVIRTSVTATGNIRSFSVYPNMFLLSVLPICYITNRYFHSPFVMMLVITILYYIAYGYRFYIASRVSGFSLREYLLKVVFRCFIVGLIGFTLVIVVDRFIPDNLWGFILLLAFSSIVLLLSIYIIGLSKEERSLLNGILLRARDSVVFLKS